MHSFVVYIFTILGFDNTSFERTNFNISEILKFSMDCSLRFLFLSSQTISLFGSMLVQYAITWYITLKTQSGAMMTISIICGFLPTFFFSFAGVWADRYNRKLLIALSDSLIALSTLILAILFFMGFDSIWLLFLYTIMGQNPTTHPADFVVY